MTKDESIHSAHSTHKESGQHGSKALGWKIATFVFAALFIATLAYTIGQKSGADASAPAADAQAGVDDTEVKLYIVNDMECKECSTEEIVTGLKTNLFSNLDVKEISYTSKEGKAMIKKYKLVMLPSLLFDKTVAESSNFPKITDAVQEIEGMYLVSSGVLRGGRLIEPPSADDDAVMGNKDAPITLIEFSDYECPFCAKFYKESFLRIKQEYIDTGKVRYVHRDYPLGFHQNAQKAAEAAECADDEGKYWQMHEKLFIEGVEGGIATFKKYAKEIGLNEMKFSKCLDSGKYEAEVKKDMSDGMTYGVSGTPAFFINGVSLTGAQPFEAFKDAIDGELARSK